MKSISFILIGTLLLAVQTSLAATQYTTKPVTKIQQTTSSTQHRLYPQVTYVAQHRTITVYSGSLRVNIERIAKAHGWNTVVWDAPDDFDWVGTTHIPASSLPSAMNAILANYPLQAVFYEGNHVLLIQPRTLR